ncbi:MAG: TonB-dependent receptor, partial [Sneathiellales bacterium]|nr:TonB-dependent receptor [Sneathiellales bacterium]
LVCSTAVLALSALSPAFSEEVKLDEIVVSAGRTPVEAEKVGRAYTVITAEELEKKQTRYVADVLRQVPGLAVSRTGSFGGLTQVRVRGSEGNHVLVLIDGVEVSNTANGEYDFGTLQAGNIERIELLRGPQSALYGSNATAGVIHIITKGGVRNDYQVTAQSELGTDRTVLGSVMVQGGTNNMDFSLSSSFRRTDGFDIAPNGNEEDGDENLTVNSKVNWDITDDLDLNFNLRFLDRDSETDAQDYTTTGFAVDATNYRKTKEYYGGLGLNWSTLDDDLVHKVRGEITDITSKSRSGTSLSGSEDVRYHASYQGTYFFDTPSLNSNHSLTGALEWERETFQNRFPSAAAQRREQSRNLYGLVAEYRGEFFEQLFVSGGLRFDRNDDFDDAVTFTTSAAYLVPSTNTRFHGSIGTGVTNPSFYEQFGFNPATFIGNPDLEPEENFGWDIGVEQKFWNKRAVIDVTYFNERLKNEIATAFLPLFVSTPINRDGTSTREGIEIAGSIQVTDNLDFNASYTYLRAEEPDGLDEVRRPKHFGSAGVNYSYSEGKGNVFVDAIFNGDMEDLEFASSTPITRVTLDHYVVFNVGADYQVTDSVKIYGRIENLFNEDYQEVYGFNTQGTTAFIGLTGKF